MVEHLPGSIPRIRGGGGDIQGEHEICHFLPFRKREHRTSFLENESLHLFPAPHSRLKVSNLPLKVLRAIREHCEKRRGETEIM